MKKILLTFGIAIAFTCKDAYAEQILHQPHEYKAEQVQLGNADRPPALRNDEGRRGQHMNPPPDDEQDLGQRMGPPPHGNRRCGQYMNPPPDDEQDLDQHMNPPPNGKGHRKALKRNSKKGRGGRKDMKRDAAEDRGPQAKQDPNDKHQEVCHG